MDVQFSTYSSPRVLESVLQDREPLFPSYEYAGQEHQLSQEIEQHFPKV